MIQAFVWLDTLASKWAIIEYISGCEGVLNRVVEALFLLSVLQTKIFIFIQSFERSQKALAFKAVLVWL